MKSTTQKPVATLAKPDFRNDDAIEFLKSFMDDSIDLILTDAPYEISKETGFASGKPTGTDVDRFRVSMNFGKWDRIGVAAHMQLMADFAEQSYQKLRKGGTLICWYDWQKMAYLQGHLQKAGFKSFRLIQWQKTNPVPLNQYTSYLSGTNEFAIVTWKGTKPTFNSKYDKGFYEMPIPRQQRFHPTQKPIELMQNLIEKHSRPGDWVVDPFSGSATTLVGAITLGRQAFGSEKDAKYFKKAKERIEAAVPNHVTLKGLK